MDDKEKEEFFKMIVSSIEGTNTNVNHLNLKFMQFINLDKLINKNWFGNLVSLEINVNNFLSEKEFNLLGEKC